MAKVAGHSGIVTVGATDIQVKKWSAKLSQEEIEITNSSSAGWREYLAGGNKVLEGTLEFDWDGTISGTGTYPVPFNATAAAVAAFVLGIGTSTKGLNFNGIIFDLEIENDHQSGPVTCSCSFKSSGAVTYDST